MTYSTDKLEAPDTAEAIRRRKEESLAYKEDSEDEAPEPRIRRPSQEHFERGEDKEEQNGI